MELALDEIDHFTGESESQRRFAPMVIAEDEIVDRFQLKSVIVPVKIRILWAVDRKWRRSRPSPRRTRPTIRLRARPRFPPARPSPVCRRREHTRGGRPIRNSRRGKAAHSVASPGVGPGQRRSARNPSIRSLLRRVLPYFARSLLNFSQWLRTSGMEFLK
jgi:hypothetical protein